MFRTSFLVYALLYSIAAFSAGDDMLGFSRSQADGQRQLEKQFDGHLKQEEIGNWIKRLSARPHHLGSANDRENAEHLVELFESWGYKTRMEKYRVLFPTPRLRLLELVAPTSYQAKLQEPALPEDETSGQLDAQLPIYNAYSVDGDVSAELVYVNYGVPEDYEELERRGIDVRGKIVLARYYGSWRGIKPKVAAEKGAIGTIIYSDPADDGFVPGDVYPKGPFRNDRGAQRGSVMDMPLYPGDPLTPDVGATRRAKRLKIEDAETLTKIPVLPISYSDALPLLQSLGGPVAPNSWKGGLPVTYHLGPGPAKVHLKLEFNWDMVDLYNVIAVLEGVSYPNQWVVRGNHHDAWVNGAADPISGLAALMAEAKAVAALTKSGWQPQRTIVYAAWDGEEQGLIGSTEWAEHHANELQNKVVAYINTDSNGRGFFRAGGSHTLEKLVNQVAREVVDPQVGESVSKRLKARIKLTGTAEQRKEAVTRRNFRLYPLGSGSDYTPFLQHLGIASLNLGYGGENRGGSYHSIYDSYDHYVRFGDPQFDYGVTLAQTGGRIVLRLANADYLPFEFEGFIDNIGKYVREVVKLTDKMREDTDRLNRTIDEGTFRLALDPTKSLTAPKREDPVPHIAFADLHNAMEILKVSVGDYQQALDRLDRQALNRNERDKLSRLIYQSERKLTRDQGLPRRPWYKHYIYAPGFYTGYGVKTLPGIREAIEERKWQEADEQVRITAGVLKGFASQIDKATQLIGKQTK
ncbi:MAG: M28 family peptidase [Pseudomonadales bacterium]|jgi:N-acetylated-alpha-linked acidic dipeptidase|nr:M28 family peptidase [Pseudomonadales bacterium]MDP7358830.1 M28 family peptidase [Pseudomonadales bacterium]MDP7594390.1 M28 family peptidase [Pseudomonadales bacterium]HJN49055.1 M28 family metallopeptidase [Pseudomonadales bacterium]|tara:strand:+ start:7344 stop:9593 length:2250 start_codon:yes stop_codon:yes gene_type:complete